MKDVPKFVRQRMVQASPENHPDANLLAAFAEGGLTSREQEQVLLHLGACATCRETLAVALPESAAASPSVAASPLDSRWLRWPMLRWAGVGAAVVVVAAAVVIQSSRHPAESQPAAPAVAAQKSEPAPSSTKPAAKDEDVRVMADRVSRKKAARDLPAKAELRADMKSESKKDAVASKLADLAPAPTPANQVAERNAPLQSSAATQSYAAAQPGREQRQISGMAGATSGGVNAMDQKQQTQSEKQQAPPPASQAQQANESLPVAGRAVVQLQKAKSPDAGQSDLARMSSTHGASAGNARSTTGSVPDAGPIPAATETVTAASAMKTALAVAPRWRLSSEGALERSTDAGRTWQLVRVASPPPQLRSFSAVDREIWAGGAGGALFRSGDRGRTWARVKVQAGDAMLDADIVRVEFTDAEHGTLQTAAGETWTTGDAGLTWSVRR